MLSLIFSRTRYHSVIYFLMITFALSFSFAVRAADEGPCLSKSDWFPHSETPRPDDAAFGSNSNCEFHQWSWQMFLWLTQKQGNEPRFLSFQSPLSLLGMDSRSMMPRMTKSATPETFNEYLQAGTDGILVDHQGRAVYYSQYVNPTFVDFITHNKLTNPAEVQKFNPNTPFDISTLELKASWKIVPAGKNVDGFFTMKTSVNKLRNKGGKIVIDPKSSETVTVALVGFHIGGVVNGHPEMIWATFEHKSNAPNVPENPTPDTIVSDKNWLFYTDRKSVV